MLALKRLIPHYYYTNLDKIDYKNLGEKENLVPSLNIFYGVVLPLGTLYTMACILELSSFKPQRSLAGGTSSVCAALNDPN
jgi:hypothetical protein